MSEPAAKKPRRPQYQGEPTVRQIMLRPKWLLALLGFLAVAAAFAGLAQWQLSHAVRINTEAPDSETPAPLETLNPPGTAISDHAAGYLAEVSGNWAAGDFSIVSERANQGETGYWVVGHLVTGGADPADLAVAIGWTADGERAHETVSRLNAEADPLAEITATPLLGRYNPTEAAKIPDGSQPPNSMSTMVPSQLLNLWQQQPQERVYAGFLVLHDTASQLPAYQLQQIDSVPPKAPETLNLLNLFYAIEWVVFAGFAIYFWVRLCRDAWEKEHELQELRAAGVRDETLPENNSATARENSKEQ